MIVLFIDSRSEDPGDKYFTFQKVLLSTGSCLSSDFDWDEKVREVSGPSGAFLWWSG